MRRIFITVLLTLFLLAFGSKEHDTYKATGEHMVQQPSVFAINNNQTKLLSTHDNNVVEAIPIVNTVNHYEANSKDTSRHPFESKYTTKEIKAGIFQSVITEENEPGTVKSVNFYTWKEENDKITILDISNFNDNEIVHGLQIGQNFLEIWLEEVNFFVSYHDLSLNTAFLEAAKSGRLVFSPIQIGDDEELVISTLGSPVINDWYHGGTYYFYNDIGFILDEQMKVVSITMPGNRLKIRLNEIPILLGEPTTISYYESENTIFYSYELEQYTLSFEAPREDKKVESIWLIENE